MRYNLSQLTSCLVFGIVAAYAAPHPQESVPTASASSPESTAPSSTSASPGPATTESTSTLLIAVTASGGITESVSIIITAPTTSAALPDTTLPAEYSVTEQALTHVATIISGSVVFTSVAATSAAPQPTGSRPAFRPGTNKNADTIKTPDGVSSFSLTGRDYLSELASFVFQPEQAQPQNVSCVYEYTRVLGGMGTPVDGEIWALPDSVWLVPSDVKQGQLGNCGLGASVMALANPDTIKYLTRTMTILNDEPNPGDRSLAASFRNDGVTTVRMDDTLPQSADVYCARFLGYQPVSDAVRPDASGQYPPTNVYYMPFIEKAWAKLLNAYPKLRRAEIAANRAATGYAGTESSDPYVVLNALTGVASHVVGRERGNHDISPSAPYQANMFVGLVACIYAKRPCVIGTPSAKDLDLLGEARTPGAYWRGVPGDESGLISRISDDPDNPSFVAYDFHYKIEQGGKTYSRPNVLVGGHAYAVDQSRSSWNSDWTKGRVTLLNPWGCNPQLGKHNNDGYCDAGDANYPIEVTMSLSLFINTVASIHWTDELPKL